MGPDDPCVGSAIGKARVELAVCQRWFDKAVTVASKTQPTPDYLADRLALIRSLSVRQALIKWLSWTWRTESLSVIRYRHASLLAQIKQMGILVGEQPPPGVEVVDEKSHTLEATQALLQSDYSLWLDEQLIRTLGEVSQHATYKNIFKRSEALYSELMLELDAEWGPKDTQKVAENERRRLDRIAEPSIGLYQLIWTATYVLIYGYALYDDVVTGVGYFRDGAIAVGGVTYIWVVWRAIVLYNDSRHQHRNKTFMQKAVIFFISPVRHVFDYLSIGRTQWRLWKRADPTVDRQRASAVMDNAHRAIDLRTYSLANNEYLPRLLMYVQILLRSKIAAFNPLAKALADSNYHLLYYKLNIMFSSTLYTHHFCCIHYRFIDCGVCRRVLSTVQDGFGLMALYIAMTLCFLKVPLRYSLSFWLIRTVLCVYADGALDLKDGRTLISRAHGWVNFLEGLLFYALHPFTLIASETCILVCNIIELAALMGLYCFVCHHKEEQVLWAWLYGAWFAFIVSRILRETNNFIRETNEKRYIL